MTGMRFPTALNAHGAVNRAVTCALSMEAI